MDLPVRRLHRHEHRLRAGENRGRTVILVVRLEHDYFVAWIDQRQEHRRHRLRRAAAHRDLPLRIYLHPVPAPVLLGDRQPERWTPPGDRVLIDVATDRCARRILHRLGHWEVGESLRQIDRAVLVRHASHLADHRLRKRAGALRGRCAGRNILGVCHSIIVVRISA